MSDLSAAFARRYENKVRMVPDGPWSGELPPAGSTLCPTLLSRAAFLQKGDPLMPDRPAAPVVPRRPHRYLDAAFLTTLVVQIAVVAFAAQLVIAAARIPACPAKEHVHAWPR
jgi:hypothetical protein